MVFTAGRPCRLQGAVQTAARAGGEPTAQEQEPPTLPELLKFAKENTPDGADRIPNEQGNRVIKRLRLRGLVAVTVLRDKAKTRYELTDIGHFVASQLAHLGEGVASV